MGAYKIGLSTAVSLVIANMIGTGVFTSLGFQVIDLHSGFSVLFLWIVGGIIALCGALTYAEIGAAYPENGGEYNYLSKLYHPALGFLSGWVSVTVGFAAPIAAATVALSNYVIKIYPFFNVTLLSCSVIVGLTVLHAINLKAGDFFQRIFTFIKVLCIVVFILFGLFFKPSHTINFQPDAASLSEIFSTAFAASLVFVTYAYSGWNAASYISGEIKDARKNLPKALVIGTLSVVLIYTALNYVFLVTVPVSELEGVLEVGYLSATKIFGLQIGKLMSLVIAILLISTVSAMVLAGPRVMQSMGQHIHGLRFFAMANKNRVPYVAVIFQSLIALVLVFTSSFQSLITYVSFTLNVFTFLTVLGVFILRHKHKKVASGYKTPLYPLTPIVFLVIILWVLYNIVISSPTESLLGLATVVVGLFLYLITNTTIKGKKMSRTNETD